MFQLQATYTKNNFRSAVTTLAHIQAVNII